ncbi:MAG: hypothetical protein D3926_01770 [Desulfobacteraceae bacterium]|nr:MAG: hypothetical protein D3926_01770 [Desulfobacteraceae bacterium]
MRDTCKTEHDTQTREEVDTEAREEEGVFCRVCSLLITHPEHKIAIQGEFSRVFANPHGIVFDIGYYSLAPGCVKLSPPSDEFTWFPGYEWTIVGCRQCSTHLGWFFSSRDDGFWGLILDRLAGTI